jgi:hypothetical protein
MTPAPRGSGPPPSAYKKKASEPRRQGQRSRGKNPPRGAKGKGL